MLKHLINIEQEGHFHKKLSTRSRAKFLIKNFVAIAVTALHISKSNIVMEKIRHYCFSRHSFHLGVLISWSVYYTLIFSIRNLVALYPHVLACPQVSER